MNPFIETSLVVLLAAFVAFLGTWMGKRKGQIWVAGFALAFVPLILIAVASNSRELSFTAPFSWLMRGRREWVAMAMIAPLVLSVLAVRMEKRRQRFILHALSAICVLRIGIAPFIAPAFGREELASLKTQIDSRGVCMQGTSFTCGPAAAVTALRRLGIEAHEGELALLFQTNMLTGTPDDVLAEKLGQYYAAQGLRVERRPMRSALELRDVPAALAVVKLGLFIDHFVAVLSVDETNIVIGDPLAGWQSMTHAEFEKEWRHVAITLRRD